MQFLNEGFFMIIIIIIKGEIKAKPTWPCVKVIAP